MLPPFIVVLNLTLALALLSMLSALRHGARRLTTTQTNTGYKQLLVQEAQGLTVVKATSVDATSQANTNTFTSLAVAGKWQAQGHQSQCGHGPLCNCKNGEGPFAAYINNNNK